MAKLRPDMSEVSMRWHLNAIRNPMYLYLKHYGLFSKRGAALRLMFIKHVEFFFALTRPIRSNVGYFLNGTLRARKCLRALRDMSLGPAIRFVGGIEKGARGRRASAGAVRRQVPREDPRTRRVMTETGLL